MSARILLRVGAYVIPLTSISEKEIGDTKGGSGYGRVGFVGRESCERRKGLENTFPSLEVILYIKEKISIERIENCEGSWDVIGSNCYANKTDWRSNFQQFGY